MQNDSTLMSAAADTLTLGGVLAFIMKFTPLITALVLTTALVLNIMRIYDWFKDKNNADTRKKK
jgi:hypothetical protein